MQSELSDVDRSVMALRDTGLRVNVAARVTIPFGPVLTAQVPALRRAARLRAGRRDEELVVLRADKP